MKLLQMIGVEPVRNIEEAEPAEAQFPVARVSEADLSTKLDEVVKRLESIESSQFVVAEILVALIKRCEGDITFLPSVDIQQRHLPSLQQTPFRIDFKPSIGSQPQI